MPSRTRTIRSKAAAHVPIRFTDRNRERLTVLVLVLVLAPPPRTQPILWNNNRANEPFQRSATHRHTRARDSAHVWAGGLGSVRVCLCHLSPRMCVFRTCFCSSGTHFYGGEYFTRHVSPMMYDKWRLTHVRDCGIGAGYLTWRGRAHGGLPSSDRLCASLGI